MCMRARAHSILCLRVGVCSRACACACACACAHARARARALLCVRACVRVLSRVRMRARARARARVRAWACTRVRFLVSGMKRERERGVNGQVNFEGREPEADEILDADGARARARACVRAGVCAHAPAWVRREWARVRSRVRARARMLACERARAGPK